jgi:hypothetical protein
MEGAIIILSAISVFAVGSVIYFALQDKRQAKTHQENN